MKFPDKKWLIDICGIGKGEKCCRYLMCGSEGWECGKKNPQFKVLIDSRVENETFVARGNNCDGPNAPTRILN
jgi:hypothetical protein